MYVVLEGMLSICFMLCHPLRERSILRKKNNRYWGNPYFPLDGNEKERFADGTTTFLASTFRRCMYNIGGMLLIFGQWHHPLTNPKWWKTFYARRTIPISSKTVLSDGQKWHVFHRCMAAAGIPEQYRRMQLGFTVRNIFFVLLNCGVGWFILVLVRWNPENLFLGYLRTHNGFVACIAGLTGTTHSDENIRNGFPEASR